MPTKFHIEVFVNAGVSRSKLMAIPEPIDHEVFKPNRVLPPFLMPHEFVPSGTKPFIFLSIFKVTSEFTVLMNEIVGSSKGLEISY